MSEPKSKLGKAMLEKGKSTGDKLDAPSKPWTGPEGEGPNGGVTQGMIGRFLICRERFKVRVWDGLGEKDKFSPLMEYGNFWHAGEEAYKTDPTRQNKWLEAILAYRDILWHKYPMDREVITHWYNLCREQFPIYIDYWSSEKEEQNRTRLLSEQVFDVPYKLPYSGRIVRLRGKWDGVSLIKAEERTKSGKLIPGLKEGIWLDENKTKSQVEQTKITRQLRFDLQTMVYLIALHEQPSCDLPRKGYYRHGGGETVNGVTRSGGASAGEYPIKGVRYNVVKRSAHKSADSMVKKIQEDIADNRGGEWFGRWNVEISQTDIDKFKRTCLDPVLEQMCDWYQYTFWDTEQWAGKAGGWANKFINDLRTCTWRHPYGVWNPIEHGEDVVDEFLNTGSRVGLQRITNLFPELQGEEAFSGSSKARS